MILQGIKRTAASGPMPKIPVTVSDITRLLRASARVSREADHLRFAAMATVAFYGFLRPSELCVSRAGHQLLWGSVKFGSKGSSVILNFGTYKHSRGSCSVKVRAVSGVGHCPVEALAAYRDCCERRSRVVPLFNVSAAEFQSTLTDLCRVAGMKHHLTPHCFRHGGATWAGRQGWPDTRIRAHGRWNSDAYKCYVRGY
jgi:integrase